MPRLAAIEWARLVITGIVIAWVPALSTRTIASAGTAVAGTVDISSLRSQRRGVCRGYALIPDRCGPNPYSVPIREILVT